MSMGVTMVYNSGEKGVEPLTYGFGDHYSTIKTILLVGIDPMA